MRQESLVGRRPGEEAALMALCFLRRPGFFQVGRKSIRHRNNTTNSSSRNSVVVVVVVVEVVVVVVAVVMRSRSSNNY